MECQSKIMPMKISDWHIYHKPKNVGYCRCQRHLPPAAACCFLIATWTGICRASGLVEMVKINGFAHTSGETMWGYIVLLARSNKKSETEWFFMVLPAIHLKSRHSTSMVFVNLQQIKCGRTRIQCHFNQEKYDGIAWFAFWFMETVSVGRSWPTVF